MPVYEFRCPDCGKTFDVLRPREKAGDSAACPDDGSEAIRVFGATFISSPSVDTDFDMDDLGGMGDDMGMGGMGGMGGMDDDFGDMDF